MTSDSFCSYDFTKKLLSSTSDPGAENLPQWKIMLCGGIAGIVTWASIFPLDVIKTRIQSQALPPSTISSVIPPLSSSRTTLVATQVDYGSRQQSASVSSMPGSPSSRASIHSTVVQPRLSTWAITRNIYQTEGLGVFFRGLGICSVRAFIVNAVQWAVYEWMMVVLLPTKGI